MKYEANFYLFYTKKLVFFNYFYYVRYLLSIKCLNNCV